MHRLILVVALVGYGMGLVAPDIHAAENVSENKSRVEAFASTGLFTPLKSCNLPNSCKAKQYLKQRKKIFQTSNDWDVDQRELSFDGMEVMLWYVLAAPSPDGRAVKPYGRKPVILRVRITKPHWQVDYGLRVGVSRTVVTQKLGQGQEHGNCLLYLNEERQDQVQFCFQAGRVKSIEWIPWNDA